MAFNIDNLLIKRVRRVVFADASTGDIYFNATEIESPNLSITSEGTTKNDAFGVPIATFYSGDSAEFSAESSLFSLGILAAQFGNAIEQATETNPIETPCIEIITVGKDANGDTNKTITLKNKPVGVTGAEIPFIYVQQKNKTFGAKYKVATAVSATEFTLDAENKTITLPTDADNITADTKIFVRYAYEATSAVKVDKNSGNEPLSGIAEVHVIFCDPCNKNKEYAGWLVFGNAQLSPEVDLTFDTESTHPLSFTCQKEWCEEEGRLLSVIVPNTDE